MKIKLKEQGSIRNWQTSEDVLKLTSCWFMTLENGLRKINEICWLLSVYVFLNLIS